jgi:hypothetical protein
MLSSQQDQHDRKEVLENDRRVREQGSTYLAHTHDDEGGRWAKPSMVVGTTPTPQYPGAAPAWAHDPSGVEPPLNYQIDALEPVGTFQEIQKSLSEPAQPSFAGSEGDCDAGAPVARGGANLPPSVGAPDRSRRR